MASTQNAPPVDATNREPESPGGAGPEPGDLKRKASAHEDDIDAGYSKRTRPESFGDDQRGRSPSPYPQRRPSSGSLSYDDPAARRKPATLEEKKRGKRLFGGLLSTLSQTNANSQQKRRQEIEKRQQERLHKLRIEDDQKREERLARLTKIRMAEQIEFEEKVMKHKHSKLLWTAQHLKTKTKPHIYYLPWKLTRQQEDILDDQMRDAKETIKVEREKFKERERRHIELYGPRKLAPPPRTSTPPTVRDGKISAAEPIPDDDEVSKPVKGARDGGRDHDDANDVVVEADEDMVIY